MFFEVTSQILGGEIFTPQIWGYGFQGNLDFGGNFSLVFLLFSPSLVVKSWKLFLSPTLWRAPRQFPSISVISFGNSAVNSR